MRPPPDPTADGGFLATSQAAFDAWTDDRFAEVEEIQRPAIASPQFVEDTPPGPITGGEAVLTFEVDPTLPGPFLLRARGSCEGDGTVRITFRSNDGSITLDPSDPFPCDGTTATIDRLLPDASSWLVELTAQDDEVTASRAWLGTAAITDDVQE